MSEVGIAQSLHSRRMVDGSVRQAMGYLSKALESYPSVDRDDPMDDTYDKISEAWLLCREVVQRLGRM